MIFFTSEMKFAFGVYSLFIAETVSFFGKTRKLDFEVFFVVYDGA